jgi:DNA-directed RNA polymerase subunit H (RpoH/RPB5)
MASQNTSSIISQIYKSRCVILELMKKQDYDVSDYDGFSINEINTMKTNNQLDMILSKKSLEQKSGENSDENIDKNSEEFKSSKEKNEKKIYIKYYLGKSLRPNNLQEMIDDLFNVEEVLTKEDTLLIVVKDEVNDTLVNTLKHIWESEKIFIILIPLQRLQFNILEHILVPSHRVLSESEKINIKNIYNIIDDNQIPELSRFDPVAKAIGIRPGEVCEIIRPSKTAISAAYYRICA